MLYARPTMYHIFAVNHQIHLHKVIIIIIIKKDNNKVYLLPLFIFHVTVPIGILKYNVNNTIIQDQLN